MHPVLLASLLFISCIFARDHVTCASKGASRTSPILFTQIDNKPNTTQLEPYQISTYVHVITTTAKQGTYTRSMVQDQIEVMNKAYAPSFNFTLADADFTVNELWASDDFTKSDQWARADATDTAEYIESEFEREYKKLLKKAKTYSELDLYFLSDLTMDQEPGLYGICTMPIDHPSAMDFMLDGCTILADTMPGGDMSPKNLGLTAVHEIGHRLGLFHTFRGRNCSGPGDYVSDTPLQKNSTDGCPASQDTCLESPGHDATNNYMDYSDDRCMSEFTPLQRVRMLHFYRTLRLVPGQGRA